MNKKNMFTRFITDNLDNAYRFAYLYTKNKQDAEDVVNESVLKALRSINTLREPKYIKTWFYKIIINTSKTMFSKNAKLVLMEEAQTDSLNIEELKYYDDYSSLDFNEIIEKLSPDNRAVIVLRFYEDYKISQIAEILNLNESTVKKRLYTSLKKLKMEMEEKENE